MTGTCRQAVSEGYLSIDPANFQLAHIRLHVAPSVTSKKRSCTYACYNLVVSTHTAALLRERRGIKPTGFSAAPVRGRQDRSRISSERRQRLEIAADRRPMGIAPLAHPRSPFHGRRRSV